MNFLRHILASTFRPQRTRISFDIDDTLACHGAGVPTEDSHVPAFIHRWFGEPLRHGTGSLVRELRRRGCSVWIYTTSGRTPFYIRRWLLLHGIRVDGVVNSERHSHGLAVHGFSRLPSKFPPAFGIDLHVDDSEGVRMEGDTHGFRVVVVRPDDASWALRVLDAVDLAQAA
ncbi:hypothetical protein [Propionivibrio sp.]|uniref:hypothetical protein n=1 Tax=Propionivibrio sp. TaxID=2212460 RepID=UPI003BEF8B12